MSYKVHIFHETKTLNAFYVYSYCHRYMYAHHFMGVVLKFVLFYTVDSLAYVHSYFSYRCRCILFYVSQFKGKL